MKKPAFKFELLEPSMRDGIYPPHLWRLGKISHREVRVALPNAIINCIRA